MPTIQRILVAVDFGPASEAAVEQALTLAVAFGANLTILHVCEIPAWAYPGVATIPMPEAARAIEESARASLDEVVRRAIVRCPSAVGTLEQGTAWTLINEVAKQIEANVIVIGTHGRRGWLSHALIGSVAEKVVRTATVPVLTVHAPSPARIAATESGSATPIG